MGKHVCPVWVGRLLSSRLRRLWHNPQKMLAPYVKAGMTVLDVGCAMGFFSLPLARLVGSSGTVICVDIQEKMIRSLEKRARKSGLSKRIETRVCRADTLGLDDFKGRIDFALASAVVHEVTDVSRFFSEIREVIKPTGNLLVAEPKVHVSQESFERSVSIARHRGFEEIERPQISRSRAVLLRKNAPNEMTRQTKFEDSVISQPT